MADDRHVSDPDGPRPRPHRDVEVFDREAERYHGVRPRYRDEWIDHVVAGLPPHARALEIGCGPGTATLPLLDRGLRVVAVERGPRLVAKARSLTRGRAVELVCSPFEDFEPEPSAFDLVLSARSWHWLEKQGRDARIARALRPEGRLAILQMFPCGNWAEGQDLYRRYWPPDDGDDGFPTPAERIARLRADVEREGVLAVADVRTWPDDHVYTSATYVDLLRTSSDHGALPHDVGEAFLAAVRERIDALGGSIVRPHEVVALRAYRH